MRARRGAAAGWLVVGLYAVAVVVVGAREIGRADFDRRPAPSAAAEFARAWERSRLATVVTSGTYERRSEVTDVHLSSEDVVAQRPPRRLHRQLGGIEGRDDDRLLVCPAPPSDSTSDAPPCRLGPRRGPSYAQSVADEVAGIVSLTTGDRPVYEVRFGDPGCFVLRLVRVEPRAPFGIAASFCFDARTGAVRSSRVRHEGGIVEVLVVTSIRTVVTDRDLQP